MIKVITSKEIIWFPEKNLWNFRNSQNFKVSSGSSLSLIENKAKKLGFTEVNSDIQVISTSYALNLSHEN